MKSKNKSKNKIFTTNFTTITILLLIVVVGLILLFLFPLIKFRHWYKWWNTYDTKNQYNCFRLSSIAYFESNQLVYNISNLFIKPRQKFKYDWWVYFITGFLNGGAKGIVDGGWVTPKHLCDSLVPDTPPTEDVGKWPIFAADWVKLVQSWGAIVYGPDKYTFDIDVWKAKSDNFLWRDWNIPPDSGLVIGFITGYSTSPLPGNEILWPDLMEPLLGIRTGIASGGWWGFLQNNGNFAGRGLDEANRLIWADQRPKALVKPKAQKSTCDGYGVANGSIQTGIGASFVGAAVASGPGGLIAGIIGLIVGAVTSAGSQGCF
jgi:hypothetical protein